MHDSFILHRSMHKYFLLNCGEYDFGDYRFAKPFYARYAMKFMQHFEYIL